MYLSLSPCSCSMRGRAQTSGDFSSLFTGNFYFEIPVLGYFLSKSKGKNWNSFYFTHLFLLQTRKINDFFSSDFLIFLISPNDIF